MSDEDYGVGYGRPPKHGQFKKGRSGNPKGRPKGSNNSANIGSMLQKICHEPVIVKEAGGRTRKISKIEAIFTQQMNAAVKGDSKAMKTVFTVLKQHPALMEPPMGTPVLQIEFVKPDEKSNREMEERIARARKEGQERGKLQSDTEDPPSE